MRVKRRYFGMDLTTLTLGALALGAGFIACSTPDVSKVQVMESPPGETSSSPGQNPYGQNAGTGNYPVGAAPQARSSPSPTAPPPRFSE